MLKTDFYKIQEAIKSIQGWCSPTEAHALYQAAKNCSGKGVIVEIGSWKGKSTIPLGLGSQDGKKIKIYAIDPHTGSPDQQEFGKPIWTLEKFKKNINAIGISNLVEPMVATGEETVAIWNKPVELIYIDAQFHDYQLTKNLLLSWSKYLVNGGVLALHNTAPSLKDIFNGLPMHGCPGPKQAAKECIFRSGNFKNIRIAGTITLAEKNSDLNASDKIRNWLVLIKLNWLYLLHGLYSIASRLPAPVKALFR